MLLNIRTALDWKLNRSSLRERLADIIMINVVCAHSIHNSTIVENENNRLVISSHYTEGGGRCGGERMGGKGQGKEENRESIGGGGG